MFHSLRLLFTVVILSLFLSACASDEVDDLRKETKGYSVEKLYAAAHDELIKENWKKAISLYEILESTYPYGSYAQKCLLELAFAFYQDDQGDMALAQVDQFIRTYPTNDSMDYALYLKGYINFKNDKGLLSWLSRQDLSERDPLTLREGYSSFAELANRFPNSRYTPDAKVKMNLLIAALARGELYCARHYMQIKAYLAAINRAQNLITSYPNTEYVEEGLAIQMAAYKDLGDDKHSDEIRQVLALNFPNSEYLYKTWEMIDIPWYSFMRD